LDSIKLNNLGPIWHVINWLSGFYKEKLSGSYKDKLLGSYKEKLSGPCKEKLLGPYKEILRELILWYFETVIQMCTTIRIAWPL